MMREITASGLRHVAIAAGVLPDDETPAGSLADVESAVRDALAARLVVIAPSTFSYDGKRVVEWTPAVATGDGRDHWDYEDLFAGETAPTWAQSAYEACEEIIRKNVFKRLAELARDGAIATRDITAIANVVVRLCSDPRLPKPYVYPTHGENNDGPMDGFQVEWEQGSFRATVSWRLIGARTMEVYAVDLALKDDKYCGELVEDIPLTSVDEAVAVMIDTLNKVKRAE